MPRGGENYPPRPPPPPPQCSPAQYTQRPAVPPPPVVDLLSQLYAILPAISQLLHQFIPHQSKAPHSYTREKEGSRQGTRAATDIPVTMHRIHNYV